MTVKKILKIGDPILLAQAQKIETFNTPELQQLIQDLDDTMMHLNGAGIAAPQIGVNQRVMIFGADKLNPRYPDAPIIPKTIIINPSFQALSNEMEEDIEGCLSVPHLRGLVPRYTKIAYQGFDPKGEPLTGTLEHFAARVFQHEIDHLDGDLFIFRIKNLRSLFFIE